MNTKHADLVNLAILGAAIGAMGLFNYIVDPFERLSTPYFAAPRHQIGRDFSQWDWEVAQYEKRPAPHLILGDSRGDGLSEARLEERLGEPAANLSYGGGTLEDIFATFDYARARTRLKTVTIALGFSTLDATNARNNAASAIEGLRDPVLFYLSPFTTQASITVLAGRQGMDLAANRPPPVDKSTFWQMQLGLSTENALSTYEYPVHGLRRLADLADTCTREGIDLRIVYMPTHVDLHARLDDFGLRDEYERTKTDLAAIAPLYDYDRDTPLTRDRDNFGDPYHMDRSWGPRLIDEIWGGTPWMAEVRRPPARAR